MQPAWHWLHFEEQSAAEPPHSSWSKAKPAAVMAATVREMGAPIGSGPEGCGSSGVGSGW
ncbi:hypothetical protein [Micromonospora saelicesensis]|uniref:hypothetical protein n=1 Tax=Micromonospora saelicesensis TaxID=285676 RepID=UPI0015EBD9F2|nr:hypothetical protein [Micromonospora saelicesensis]